MDIGIDPDNFGLAYGLITIDYSSLIVKKCNSQFTEITGLSEDPDFDVSYKAFGEDKEKFLQQILKNDETSLEFMSTGKTMSFRVYRHKVGSIELLGIDSTKNRKMMEMMEMMEMRTRGFQQFIENLNGVSFQRMLKPEAQAVFTAGIVEKLTGYPESQARDLVHWLEIVHPEDKGRIEQIGYELYEKSGYEEETEYRIIRKDGEIRWVRSYDSHFLSDNGEYEMVQGLIVDVTEYKKQEALLEEMTMTDHLTGLSNRRLLQKILNYSISDFKRTGHVFSLIMIDLDHFKQINDTYGHDAGDSVLKRMGEILNNNLRETDIKARWGGEEFLILLPKTDKTEVEIIANKLLSVVRDTVVTHHNLDIHFTFSCGISVNKQKLSMEVLLKQADQALYRAKEEGRNRSVVY